MRKLGLVLLAGLSFNAIAARTTQSSLNVSEQNRTDKKFQVTAGLGFNYSLPTLGLQAGMLLDENNVLGLGVYSFNDTDTEDEY